MKFIELSLLSCLSSVLYEEYDSIIKSINFRYPNLNTAQNAFQLKYVQNQITQFHFLIRYIKEQIEVVKFCVRVFDIFSDQ